MGVDDSGKAFDLSLQDHQGERRSNGDPAIYRSLSVAQIVVEELGLGRTSVICALLYDIVQKEHVATIDNATLFNDTIYDLEAGFHQERLKIVGYVFPFED